VRLPHFGGTSGPGVEKTEIYCGVLVNSMARVWKGLYLFRRNGHLNSDHLVRWLDLHLADGALRRGPSRFLVRRLAILKGETYRSYDGR
jgi:hypothetical protein